MPGIAAWGACIPRLRLARSTIGAAMGWVNKGLAAGRGERSICSWDEDSLTLAVEAARDALPSMEARAGLGHVTLASTTLPFADRSNAAVLATALGLGEGTLAQDASGSQRAGTAALAQALAACGAPGARPALVVAADRRFAKPGSDQEAAYGHGAAAMLATPGDGVAKLVATRHLTADFVDHYRGSGEAFDYTLEERWTREAGWFELVPGTLKALIEDAGLAPASVDHVVISAPAAAAKRVAALSGLREEALADTLAGRCGDTGCGHPLLMFGSVLERASPGEHVLVVGFGQGVDALLFRVTDAVRGFRPARGAEGCLADRREETSYTRFLSHCGLLAVDFGMRAERDSRTAMTVLWRKHEDITGFTGGRCRDCGTVQFPRSRVCVNPDCRRTDTQEPHRLAESAGRIKTFTEDWLAYSARPPLVYGNVAFEEGGNAFIEFADFEPGEAKVGAPVRFVFRLKDVDRVRGFRRYFWKAAPAGSA
ncbi:MAG: zinc ribbon domain-containing protein [Steroidobacteraceae bacterium]|jgi:3-hydroxy-3-methylglutaryl CoA synthase|nr:zinc ribbon domain-containing protein [Steroidobacteraceae bacterium]